MAANPTTQLLEVQAAITKVHTAGQSYTIGDRKFTRADLETLRVMERDLLARAARSSGRRPAFSKVNMSGSFS